MKKRFTCGHLGNGSYCHRCKQEEEEKKRKKEVVKEKEIFDPRIDIQLPKAAARKANKLLKEIEKATHYREINGKKLKLDNGIITVRLSRKYRMIFRSVKKKLSFVKITDHGTFDKEHSGQRIKRT